LYIHSAISEHRTTIGKVWLRHAIYSIVYDEIEMNLIRIVFFIEFSHIRGRVFVSLANEKITVFHRNPAGRINKGL
jgi:hypothetical protein